MKYSFANDYTSGAHPRLFEALLECNDSPQHLTYGTDERSESARHIIRQLIDRPEAEVVFLSGGTQTNLIALSFQMKSWEAVVAVESGHIAVLETGAIEFTGHKVITVKSQDDKIYPELITPVLEEHCMVHMVVPRVVFISQCTERGGMYTRAELYALRAYCDEHNLLLHLDGARLGAAMASTENDITYKDIGRCCDSFYIGGTKSGALFGEALVLINPAFKMEPGIRHHIKQRGGLMSKGWMMGVQFEELLKNEAELMNSMCRHANHAAKIIKDGFESCGFHLLFHSSTNLLFFEMPSEVVEELEKEFMFMRWKVDKVKHTTQFRVATMWNTKEDQCHRMVIMLRRIMQESV